MKEKLPAKPTPKPAKPAPIAPTPKATVPLLEFDPATKTIIEAKSLFKTQPHAKRCLITYFEDVVEKLVAEDVLEPAFVIRSEGLRPRVYKITDAKEITYVLLTSVGAPNAARAVETMCALGVKKFIVTSGAGTLNSNVTKDKICLPASCVRDEGTSYHYASPARESKIDKTTMEKIKSVLDKNQVQYETTKSWSTDGIFRQTTARVANRIREGCQMVEMECAAYYSVAAFKNVALGALYYCGDIVKKEGWEYKIWHTATQIRERVFELGLKCLAVL